MNKYSKILQLLQSLSDEEINKLLEIQGIDKQIEIDKDLNIESLLKELCVNPSLLGFNYLKDAIEMCLKNQNILSGITKVLYPTIATKYNTSPTRVERAIRHAIDTSWGKITEDIYHQVFFNELERPTNSKYIAYVCSYVKNIKISSDKKPTQKIYNISRV